MIQIWTLILALSCWTCAAPVSETLAPSESEPRKTIYLVNNGWHAGIVLRRADIPDNIWPKLVNFHEMEYLEVGWGDKDLYQIPDPHLGFFLKGGLLPTASVLHIVGFNDHVATYFPYSEIIRIELSSAGFERLSRTIASSFALDKAGNSTSPSPGRYENSRFYLSRETYHFFNTCNVWTARALRTAGLPFIPATAIRTENLMSQARKFGVVVQQSESEPSE
jgi:uncharacterized protein (TIGR02117 family)